MFSPAAPIFILNVRQKTEKNKRHSWSHLYIFFKLKRAISKCRNFHCVKSIRSFLMRQTSTTRSHISCNQTNEKYASTSSVTSQSTLQCRSAKLFVTSSKKWNHNSNQLSCRTKVSSTFRMAHKGNILSWKGQNTLAVIGEAILCNENDTSAAIK